MGNQYPARPAAVKKEGGSGYARIERHGHSSFLAPPTKRGYRTSKCLKITIKYVVEDPCESKWTQTDRLTGTVR